ncbi:MAG: glycosyltransferase family 9 protein [Lachnospiraceae bacterium]|nr:glycosyltransferase family 9 protein [Lachnospiraceae bacterium]
MLSKLLVKLYSYVVIYGHIFRCKIENKVHKRKAEKDRVIILTAGGIGDAIVSLQAYKALCDYFMSLNKELYLITDAALHTGLKMVLSEKYEEIQWRICDFLNGKMDRDKLYSFQTLTKEIREFKIERIIIMSNIMVQYRRACYVAACLDPGVVNTGLYDSYPQGIWRRFRLYAIENIFYRINRLPDGLHESIFWKRFINKIGEFDYKVSIPYIERQCAYNPGGEKGYLVIAVDSSNVKRRWPSENFIELINKLLKMVKYDIVLTASNVTEATREQYETAFHGCSRVIVLIGMLTTGEWVELVRGAQFVVGVDSGIIHVAAAVSTQAFCITGAWNGHRFYPYIQEKRNEMTIEPKCIYRGDIDVGQLSCANCISKAYYGYGNHNCKNQIKAGKPVLCLLNVSPDDVLRTIGEAFILTANREDY